MPELQPIAVPMDGVAAIARERGHQVLKGYSPEHDAEHGPFQLINAALAYAVQAGDRVALADGLATAVEGPETYWPWDSSTFSDTDDELESLSKAGALIAAAYDVALARRAER